MVNREFFFFYAPTWDFPPDGPIKLGNVLTSIKNPQRPLTCSLPNSSAMLETEKKSVRYTKEKLRTGKFSILTRFFGMLGVSVDTWSDMQNSDEETFSFDTIETTQFIPTTAYLQNCIEADNIRRFLEAGRYRKPIYIITGLKIVTGAKVSSSKSRSLGGSLGVQADTSILGGSGPPVLIGPGATAEVSNQAKTSWEDSSPFIFAFRTSRVFVAKDTNQVQSEEDYTKGAMLGNETAMQAGMPKLHIAQVDEANAETEACDAEELMEDTDIVYFAILRGQVGDDDD